jgi:hypothetical protein
MKTWENDLLKGVALQGEFGLLGECGFVATVARAC